MATLGHAGQEHRQHCIVVFLRTRKRNLKQVVGNFAICLMCGYCLPVGKQSAKPCVRTRQLTCRKSVLKLLDSMAGSLRTMLAASRTRAWSYGNSPAQPTSLLNASHGPFFLQPFPCRKWTLVLQSHHVRGVMPLTCSYLSQDVMEHADTAGKDLRG